MNSFTLWPFIIGILLGATSNAYAKDSEKSAELPAGKSGVYTYGRCSFMVRNLAGGRFVIADDAGFYYYERVGTEYENLGSSFSCFAEASPSEIDAQLGARLVKGRWIWAATNQPFEKAQHFRTYEFAVKNWKGHGNTYDQTTGDEATQQRLFNFCLVQTDGPQVLCVNAPIMAMDTPSSNMLAKFMTVLKSVDFVDISASTSTDAASGTAAPRQ
jgi:hypothetical protein